MILIFKNQVIQNLRKMYSNNMALAVDVLKRFRKKPKLTDKRLKYKFEIAHTHIKNLLKK